VGGDINYLLSPDERKDWIHWGERGADLSDVGETAVHVTGQEGEDGGAESGKGYVLKVRWPRRGGYSGMGEEALQPYFWEGASNGSPPKGWICAAFGARRANRYASTDAQRLAQSPPRIASIVTLFRDDAVLDGWINFISSQPEGSGISFGDGSGASLNWLHYVLAVMLSDITGNIDFISGFSIRGNRLYVRQDQWKPLTSLGDGHRVLLLMVLDILAQAIRFNQTWCIKDSSVPEPLPIIENRILLPDLIYNSAANPNPGLVYCTASGVILIDEPENHLHPALQQRLGFWLKTHFPNMQFIVTTHSPLICQAADPGGLFRMDNGKIQAVDTETWKAVANGSTDDAIVSRLFGLRDAFSSKAEKLRERIADLGFKIRQKTATEADKQERKRLLEQIHQTPSFEVAAALRERS
jgi:hypothetical protein